MLVKADKLIYRLFDSVEGCAHLMRDSLIKFVLVFRFPCHLKKPFLEDHALNLFVYVFQLYKHSWLTLVISKV